MSKHQTNVDLTDDCAEQMKIAKQMDESMSGLDSKLKIILREMECAGKYGDAHATTYEQLTAQIKQAFADEGYVYVPQVEVVTRYERGDDKPKVFMVNGKEVMTGAEWYERFEKAITEDSDIWELPEEKPQNLSEALLLFHERLKLAAKRAAGLTDV